MRPSDITDGVADDAQEKVRDDILASMRPSDITDGVSRAADEKTDLRVELQ